MAVLFNHRIGIDARVEGGENEKGFDRFMFIRVFIKLW